MFYEETTKKDKMNKEKRREEKMKQKRRRSRKRGHEGIREEGNWFGNRKKSKKCSLNSVKFVQYAFLNSEKTQCGQKD